MKRIVDVYIESISGSGDYSKLELFNDEKIDINLSVQNIQDISKVYTDFTQSFTVPASSINNAIFEHFYQSDVNTVNSSNIRRLAYIEIDLAPFRSGKIQLEKSNIKNGSVDSYTITFYGDLTAKSPLSYCGKTSLVSPYSRTPLLLDKNSLFTNDSLFSCSKEMFLYSGTRSISIESISVYVVIL